VCTLAAFLDTNGRLWGVCHETARVLGGVALDKITASSKLPRHVCHGIKRPRLEGLVPVRTTFSSRVPATCR
jgi:hypothetical protein